MAELRRILTPLMVWGLGVGYVISGNYFGWNLGLAAGGTGGLAIATLGAIVLYVTFTYSYAELACAIPKAGGAFDYAFRAWGPDFGFVAGMAQNVEFVFAPPAIAFGIGSYIGLFFPWINPLVGSVVVYALFTGLNLLGIRVAASFELIVTVIAVTGLLVFASFLLPAVKWANLTINAWPQSYGGIVAAIPYAAWFFLGIEGVANLAEETVNPNRTMSVGFLAALFTLVCVCTLTFISAVGVGGWEAVVLQADGTTSDAPLPMAVSKVMGDGHPLYYVMAAVGVVGLVASLNGLVLAAGRSTLEFGKLTAPYSVFSRIGTRSQAPTGALIANFFVGLLALLTGRTGEIIILSVLGALSLYALSMLAMMRLRWKEPELHRPFLTPGFPVFPIIAFILAVVAWISVAWHHPILCLIYCLIIAGCFGIFRLRTLRHS